MLGFGRARIFASRMHRIARVLVAVAHAFVIAIAHASLRAAVASAGRRIRIVLVVRGELRDGLFLDVVGLACCLTAMR